MIPHLDQYMGTWALEEERMRALHQLLSDRQWLSEHIAAAAAKRKDDPDPAPAYSVDGGIARIEITGFMTKYGSSLSGYAGNLATRKLVRRAREDASVGGVLLFVESGGGSVMGVDDLARDLRDLAERKPVAAYVEDIGASAAYYVASGADRIFANPAAAVGSIGVYGVVDDASAMFEKAGVIVHVIRAGQFKGIGERGTKITEEQLAELQRGVNATNDLFVAAVAAGRGISVAKARELNDGRVHKAAEALELGFIDQVGSESDAIAWLRSQIQAERTKGKTMEGNGNDAGAAGTATAPTVSTPQAATLKELKAEFPDSDAQWREGCMEIGLTMEQAKDAWIKHLGEKTKAAEERAAKAEKEAADAKAAAGKNQPGKSAIGVDPVSEKGADGAFEGDAIVAWNKAVQAEMERTKDRSKAISAVVRNNPELHQAYLAAVNGRRK